MPIMLDTKTGYKPDSPSDLRVKEERAARQGFYERTLAAACNRTVYATISKNGSGPHYYTNKDLAGSPPYTPTGTQPPKYR